MPSTVVASRLRSWKRRKHRYPMTDELKRKQREARKLNKQPTKKK